MPQVWLKWGNLWKSGNSVTPQIAHIVACQRMLHTSVYVRAQVLRIFGMQPTLFGSVDGVSGYRPQYLCSNVTVFTILEVWFLFSIQPSVLFLRRHQATIGHWMEFDFGRMTSKRVGSCATGMLQSNKVQKIRKVMDCVYYIETMAGSMGFMGS